MGGGSYPLSPGPLGWWPTLGPKMRILESSALELGTVGFASGQEGGWGMLPPSSSPLSFLPSLFLSSTPIAFLSPRSLPLALAEPYPSEPAPELCHAQEAQGGGIGPLRAARDTFWAETVGF